jgi:hypothetical protein
VKNFRLIYTWWDYHIKRDVKTIQIKWAKTAQNYKLQGEE